MNKEMAGGLIALVSGLEFAFAVFAAASFESTDDPKLLIIAGVLLVITLVGLVMMHVKEERDEQ